MSSEEQVHKRDRGVSKRAIRPDLSDENYALLESWFVEAKEMNAYGDYKEGGKDTRRLLYDALDEMGDAGDSLIWEPLDEDDSFYECLECVTEGISAKDRVEGLMGDGSCYGDGVCVPRFGGSAKGQFCESHLVDGSVFIANAFRCIMDQACVDFEAWNTRDAQPTAAKKSKPEARE